jgi:hypothetical protein
LLAALDIEGSTYLDWVRFRFRGGMRPGSLEIGIKRHGSPSGGGI